jgi:hypothetical protein
MDESLWMSPMSDELITDHDHGIRYIVNDEPLAGAVVVDDCNLR